MPQDILDVIPDWVWIFLFVFIVHVNAFGLIFEFPSPPPGIHTVYLVLNRTAFGFFICYFNLT